MPVNIEEQKKRHTRQAVLGLVLFGLRQLVCMASFSALCFLPNLPRWAVTLSAALAILCVLPVGFALVVLIQRLREIKGGEFYAAAEY